MRLVQPEFKIDSGLRRRFGRIAGSDPITQPPPAARGRRLACKIGQRSGQLGLRRQNERISCAEPLQHGLGERPSAVGRPGSSGPQRRAAQQIERDLGRGPPRSRPGCASRDRVDTLFRRHGLHNRHLGRARMPWRTCRPMDERLRFIARLLEGEKIPPLCREFGISRVTGYKIYERYKTCGLEGLSDRSRRPHRHATNCRIRSNARSWGSRKSTLRGAPRRSATS